MFQDSSAIAFLDTHCPEFITTSFFLPWSVTCCSVLLTCILPSLVYFHMSIQTITYLLSNLSFLSSWNRFVPDIWLPLQLFHDDDDGHCQNNDATSSLTPRLSCQTPTVRNGMTTIYNVFHLFIVQTHWTDRCHHVCHIRSLTDAFHTAVSHKHFGSILGRFSVKSLSAPLCDHRIDICYTNPIVQPHMITEQSVSNVLIIPQNVQKWSNAIGIGIGVKLMKKMGRFHANGTAVWSF